MGLNIYRTALDVSLPDYVNRVTLVPRLFKMLKIQAIFDHYIAIPESPGEKPDASAIFLSQSKGRPSRSCPKPAPVCMGQKCAA
jgi:hypothetical protein